MKVVVGLRAWLNGWMTAWQMRHGFAESTQRWEGPGWFLLRSGSIFKLERGHLIITVGQRGPAISGPFKTRTAARRHKWQNPR